METPHGSPPKDLNTAESIIAARGYAGIVGEIPSAFTSAIRGLIADQERNKGEISNGTRFSLLRLLRSPSLLSPFYYSALTFRGQFIGDPTQVTVNDLLAMFPPGDLSGIISLIYLHRKLEGIVPEASWTPLREQFKQTAEAGAHIGAAIPKIGLSLGLFVGSLPNMAGALFEKHDPKGFKEYARHLKGLPGAPYDLRYECERWGCTRFNVASMLLQTLGFGISLANNFSAGLCTPTEQIGDLDGEAYRCVITQVWISSMLLTGKPPEIRHRGEYYPQAEPLRVLLDSIESVRKKGTTHDFLAKRKEDISKASNPGLMQHAKSAAASNDTSKPATIEEEIAEE